MRTSSASDRLTATAATTGVWTVPATFRLYQRRCRAALICLQRCVAESRAAAGAAICDGERVSFSEGVSRRMRPRWRGGQ
jgi:hypothetical protein